MGKYSIKELEKLSGIKAHTLRIWEKRYNIIEPERTATNIRYYTDQDLKKILNISILNNQGLKISKIARLSQHELISKVTELSKEENEQGLFIDQLTLAMVELDEMKFEKLLSTMILRIGFQRTILEVIYPFLDKIGILWLSNNITPIQEHFISNLIRQKIIVAIDGLTLSGNQKKDKVVFFLPENELHEIGLLFYYYLIKSSGYMTYYLGQHVPLNDLQSVVTTLKPKHLVTSISYNPSDGSIGEYITQLAMKFPKCNIFITGKPIMAFTGKLPDNVTSFSNIADLKKHFTLS